MALRCWTGILNKTLVVGVDLSSDTRGEKVFADALVGGRQKVWCIQRPKFSVACPQRKRHWRLLGVAVAFDLLQLWLRCRYPKW